MKLTATILGLTAALATQAQYWNQQPNLAGAARWGAVGFATATRGYICTGVNTGGNNLNDLWEWNPATNTWTAKAAFPGTARREGAAFSINGIGYVGFGRTSPSSAPFNDLWAYDPASNTWSAKASYPAGGISAPGIFVLNGKAYVLGGNGGSAPYSNQLWEYDPVNDSWTQRTSLPATGRSGPIAFALYGKGYIGGGNDNSGDLCSSDFWEYDPSTNSWTQRADVPGIPRRAANAFVVNSIPYAGCGWNGSSCLVDMYLYNPFANTWTAVANFGGAGAYSPVAFSIGGMGYMGTGGTSSGATAQFWEYKGGPVGIDESLAASAIDPVFQQGRITLNGWTPDLADAYNILDASGRIISQGHVGNMLIDLPKGCGDGVYFLHLAHQQAPVLTHRFVMME